MSESNSILIGNTFPWPLIRRRIQAGPILLEEFQKRICMGKEIRSFWGHPDTVKEASAFCGVDLTPEAERPVLTLSPRGFPCLGDDEFRECYIISPEYEYFFRPGAPAEKEPEIIGWVILQINWEVDNETV